MARLCERLLLLATLVLAGCGATSTVPAATRARAIGFAHNVSDAPLWSRWGSAGELRFLEIVVGTDEVDATLPLVVALHGIGDGPRIPDGGYLHRARAYRLVLPEAPLLFEAGRAWSTHRASDGQPELLAADLEARVPAIVELIEVLTATRPTRGRPVLVGYSQGGHLAFVVGTQRPELFTAIVPMAAWLPPPLVPDGPPSRRTPIRGVHARDDERVPLAPTEALYDHLNALGWDARLEIVLGSHAPSPAIEDFFGRQLDAALTEIDR
ncbi:MAG: hypothetical protein J0L92_37865 [Deltaproteobacteria bacterium]|nr:hypothetical protein [Deltaproteobacteria bacterium]